MVPSTSTRGKSDSYRDRDGQMIDQRIATTRERFTHGVLGSAADAHPGRGVHGE